MENKNCESQGGNVAFAMYPSGTPPSWLDLSPEVCAIERQAWYEDTARVNNTTVQVVEGWFNND